MSKILHASIPADDPACVAATLAHLLGGLAMPFPPGGPAAWIAWGDDGRTEIEVVPRGAGLVRGMREAEWRPGETCARASKVHLAIAVPLAAATVLEIATAAQWPSRVCSRGGLFDLIEVWVEGAFLLELFDPDQAAAFAQAISAPQWQALLEAGPPPDGTDSTPPVAKVPDFVSVD